MYSFTEIKAALDRDDFFLEYMPTISLTDGRCVGAEALVRWQRDDSVIYPSDFIPGIEGTPLSGLLTYWVIETLAKELHPWLREQNAVRISINVPPEIIGRDKSFADDMLQPDWTDQKIAGIAALIRNGDLRVIAEGVETVRQVEILADAGVQMAQGWYFSRSLRAADVEPACQGRTRPLGP